VPPAFQTLDGLLASELSGAETVFTAYEKLLLSSKTDAVRKGRYIHLLQFNIFHEHIPAWIYQSGLAAKLLKQWQNPLVKEVVGRQGWNSLPWLEETSGLISLLAGRRPLSVEWHSRINIFGMRLLAAGVGQEK